MDKKKKTKADSRRSTALCTVQQLILKTFIRSTICALCLRWSAPHFHAHQLTCTRKPPTSTENSLLGVQGIKPCPVLAFFLSSHSRGPLQLAPAFLRRRCARLGKTETKHRRNRIQAPLNWKRISSCRLRLCLLKRLIMAANAPRQTHL